MKNNVMSRIALLMIAVSALSYVLCACKPKEPDFADVTVDVTELAEAINEKVSFDDEIVVLREGIVKASYGFLGQAQSFSVWAGSGGTPEEIIVAEASDVEAASALLTALSSHIDEKREIFRDYNSYELPKLDSPVVEQRGRYVICCVCGDTAPVYDVINTYFK